MTAGPDAASRATAALPVSILTGFLGSGKTTLLNRLLKHPGMGETAVLINEFGEIGLDHELVEAIDEDVVLLNAGCLCCTVRGDLARALGDLFMRRVRGEVPPFARVLIETTGLADPAPIIHTLLTDDVLRHRFALDGIVTTVDAVNGAEEIDRHAEAVKQVAVADRLVLTKTDLADDDAVEGLRATLAALNPGAPILTAISGDIAPAHVFDAGLFDPSSKTPDVARWLRDESYETHAHAPMEGHDAPGHAPHAHDPNRHGDAIQAYAMRFDAPFDWAVLTVWIQRLIANHGDRLLRLKGIVHIEGEDAPLAIHGVQHLFHDPVRLPPAGADRTSRIVFITDGLDAATIARGLSALEAQAAGLDQ